MSWAAGDDQFDVDPDIDLYNIQAAALGLFWCSVTYCCRLRNGGFIPAAAVLRLPGGTDKKSVAKLVEAGWWVAQDGGYLVRSFLKYNPACVGGPISRKRAEAGSKGGRAKAANRETTPGDGANSSSNEDGKTPSKSDFANSFATSADYSKSPSNEDSKDLDPSRARLDARPRPLSPVPEEVIVGSDSLDEGVPRARAQPLGNRSFTPPTREQVIAHFTALGNPDEGPKFFAHYEGNGWMKGEVPVVNWTMTAESWLHKGGQFKRGTKPQSTKPVAVSTSADRYAHLPETRH